MELLFEKMCQAYATCARGREASLSSGCLRYSRFTLCCVQLIELFAFVHANIDTKLAMHLTVYFVSVEKNILGETFLHFNVHNIT